VAVGIVADGRRGNFTLMGCAPNITQHAIAFLLGAQQIILTVTYFSASGCLGLSTAKKMFRRRSISVHVLKTL
jgi:hypothetical protein